MSDPTHLLRELRRTQDPPRDLSAPGQTNYSREEMLKRLEELLPLKVCRVLTRLNIGGPSVQATLLSCELKPPIFSSLLLAGVEEEREGNYLELLDHEVRRNVRLESIDTLGRAPNIAADLATLKKLVSAFRRFRPDIVHTHMAKAGTLGRLAALAAGVPIVVHTFHGNVFEGYFSRPVSLAVKAWEAMLASITDCVVAITASQVHELTNAGLPRRKIRLIPLGIPLDRFATLPDKHEARKALRIPKDAVCIGWVARLVPIKDPLLMVEAAKVASDRLGSSVVLAVAGDGPMREEVIDRANQLGLHLELLGWQPDLAPFYAACDVVALSSINEGFPVALVEAIASSRPVASTDVGGVADLFSSAGQGMLALERTPDALGQAIVEAMKTPSAQLEVSARRVRDSYGARRLVTDISALYIELAFAKASKIESRRKKRTFLEG